MLGADIAVIKIARFFLGYGKYAACSFGEFFKSAGHKDFLV
jgi:hypothetical protein